MNENPFSVDARYSNLKSILKKLERVAVAFSGGADSSFLLAVAKEILGKDVLAMTALSETIPRRDREDAVRFAKALDVPHLMVETRELEMPEFAKNPPDKCYVCKKYRFGMLLERARKKGFFHVADGENKDDEKDYRPGSLAARELGVISPLREAGLGKADIRMLSRRMGLPAWDKPAYACLASRIPTGHPITAEKLRQTDDAEEFLRELGLKPGLRVRHHGDMARIEADPEDIPKLAEKALRNRISECFKKIGFRFVALDLEGYRMGSLNHLDGGGSDLSIRAGQRHNAIRLSDKTAKFPL